MLIKKTDFKYLLTYLFGLIVTILSSSLLPRRFYYDANTIVNNYHNVSGLIGSYEFTIFFYDFTGLNKLPFWLVGFIQFSLLFLLLKKNFKQEKYYKINSKNTLIFIMYLIMSVFISMPTKEFINVIYLILVIKILRLNSRYSVLLSILAILFFSFFFRKYYLIVLLISLVLFFFKRNIFFKKYVSMIFLGLMTVVFISFVYSELTGQFLSQSTREYLNGYRDKDNRTQIVSPIPVNSIGSEIVSVLNAFFIINFPINAFKYLSPHVILFSLWQLLFMHYVIKNHHKIRENKQINKELWFYYFCTSYYIVQSVFEPDLGSVVRHKVGVFPIILFMLDFKFNEQNK